MLELLYDLLFTWNLNLDETVINILEPTMS